MYYETPYTLKKIDFLFPPQFRILSKLSSIALNTAELETTENNKYLHDIMHLCNTQKIKEKYTVSDVLHSYGFSCMYNVKPPFSSHTPCHIQNN